MKHPFLARIKVLIVSSGLMDSATIARKDRPLCQDFHSARVERYRTRIGTGSVSTIYAGNFVFQATTEHLNPPYFCEQQTLIIPPPGPVDERLMETYPKKPKQLDWPTEPFTENGLIGVILGLFGRWHIGENVSKIKNA